MSMSTQTPDPRQWLTRARPTHHHYRATRVYNKAWRRWLAAGQVKFTASHWLTVYIQIGLTRLEAQQKETQSEAAKRLYDGMIADYQAKWNRILFIEWEGAK